MVLYFHFQGLIQAYESAPRCSSAADALKDQGCRYVGEAHVLSSQDESTATVEFPALSGRSFTAVFPTAQRPNAAAVSVGTTADGELWSGKLTRLAGKRTADNPEQTPADPFLQIAIFFGVAALALLILTLGIAGFFGRILRGQSHSAAR
ncbi:MAG TPA: hypothetical protein VHO95_01875 [Candidatus Dormibacteraeota bacterium]|nr:hypothetical protein [Candidatus Dormibacteraeota bacterium]